jgi:hypothetical protein
MMTRGPYKPFDLLPNISLASEKNWSLEKIDLQKTIHQLEQHAPSPERNRVSG